MKNLFNIQLDDEQRVALFKEFIAKEYKKIIFLVLSLIIGVLGWQFYISYNNKYKLEAREVFLKISTQKNDADKYYQILQKEYARTSYANLANFFMAKYSQQKGDNNLAISYLQKILNNEQTYIVDIAKLRLAKIYLKENKYKEAKNILDSIDEQFNWRIELVKSDIALAEKDIETAKKHLEKALEYVSSQDEDLTTFISMKLYDLL